VNKEQAVRDGWNTDDVFFTLFDDAGKKITAAAMKATNADVIALQEVENLDTLKRFRSTYLGGAKAYPYAVAIDGNDPRLIDVAVLSRLPIKDARSYQHLRSGNSYIFSRDCLEVDVSVDDKSLTLFVNHLKSMLDQGDPKNGRRSTRAKRELQARSVKEIIRARFGARASRKPWMVLGDLNDYVQTDETGASGIGDLVGWNAVENVVDRLPPDERWTYYFSDTSSPEPGSYHQLDYLLPSRALAERSQSVPAIIRKGLARHADHYTGPRFRGVGVDSPAASDHCPVVWELTL
jgi:endonuclease/exonuclease/phosphatase family metal-dependent hydrolase